MIKIESEDFYIPSKAPFDLYNRETINCPLIKQISISENKYLPPLFETYLKEFYDNNLNPNTTVKHNSIIGFHSNEICERGVSVAVYDYAYYNKVLYNNISIII